MGELACEDQDQIHYSGDKIGPPEIPGECGEQEGICDEYACHSGQHEDIVRPISFTEESTEGPAILYDEGEDKLTLYVRPMVAPSGPDEGKVVWAIVGAPGSGEFDGQPIKGDFELWAYRKFCSTAGVGCATCNLVNGWIWSPYCSEEDGRISIWLCEDPPSCNTKGTLVDDAHVINCLKYNLFGSDESDYWSLMAGLPNELGKEFIDFDGFLHIFSTSGSQFHECRTWNVKAEFLQHPDYPCGGDYEICCPDGCNSGGCCDNTCCPSGHDCNQGVCTEPDPCEDVECPEGHECIDGECVCSTECCSNEDCEEGWMCIGGECVPEEDPCANCNPNCEECIEGVGCSPIQGKCCNSSDCPSGYNCENYECVPPPDPCGLKDEECCVDGCESGLRCVNEVCIPEQVEILTTLNIVEGDVQGEFVTIEATLETESGEPLAQKPVDLALEGEHVITLDTDENGRILHEIEVGVIPEGEERTIDVFFHGAPGPGQYETYLPSSDSFTVTRDMQDIDKKKGTDAGSVLFLMALAGGALYLMTRD